MHHFDGNDFDRLLYLFTWGTMFAASKVLGIFNMITNVIEEIKLPVHDIKHLPQAEDLIPALIVAACCAAVSTLVSKIVGLIWGRFVPKKVK